MENVEAKYRVLGMYRADGIQTCDNCMRQIAWVVRLQERNGEKKVINVGVDCADTLTKKTTVKMKSFSQWRDTFIPEGYFQKKARRIDYRTKVKA